jgi:hypothetical protein
MIGDILLQMFRLLTAAKERMSRGDRSTALVLMRQAHAIAVTIPERPDIADALQMVIARVTRNNEVVHG